MENFLEGGIEQLEIVKKAVVDQTQKEQEYKECDRTLKAREKEFEIQKKRIEEKINSTIKKSRAELDKKYDGQINSAEKAIKEAEIKKKNAKAEAVNLRMKRENSSLVDENKILAAEIGGRFREYGVPAICKNRYYYALFQPKNKSDLIICIIAVLLCVFVIPFLITRAASTEFLAVLIWILIVVFFAAVYFLISAWTRKGNRNEELLRARSSIDRITENKKHIKKRNKNIKADPDESQYNLTEYDIQVQQAKTACAEIKAEKDEAVKHFEQIESVDIRQRMETEYASTLESLQHDIGLLKDDLMTKTEKYQEANRILSGYKELLGDKNTKVEKIDEIMAVINEGRAGTIGQALEVQKNK